MRHRYLATAAAVALLAGIGGASAQVEKKPEDPSAPGATLRGKTEKAPQTQMPGSGEGQTRKNGKEMPGQAQQPGKDRPGQAQEPTKERPGTAQQPPATAPDARGGAQIQLSQQQRTRIRNVIIERKSDLRSVSKVDFQINVGVAVPRTVQLFPLPRYIVEVVPEYEGFFYILVGSQLVIIHPQTYVIVAVIQV